MCAELLDVIEWMLSFGLVHGDFSPSNVLVWNERPVVIDVTQAPSLGRSDGVRAPLRSAVHPDRVYAP